MNVRCDACVVEPASDPSPREALLWYNLPFLRCSLPPTHRLIQVTIAQSSGAPSTAASTPASPCNKSPSGGWVYLCLEMPMVAIYFGKLGSCEYEVLHICVRGRFAARTTSFRVHRFSFRSIHLLH